VVVVVQQVGMAVETLKMPMVHHLTLDEAQRTLTAAGVAFTIHRSQSMAPEGELIGASPRPGAIPGDGDEAILTVSAGPPKTTS